MRSWKVSKLWPGATVFILGGGPSLSQVDLAPLQHEHVIGVNDAFKLGAWVDICWWGDCRWGIWNLDELLKYQGLNVSCTRCNCQHPKTLQVRRKEGSGISMNPEEVFWNKSSGASAINLAYHLGASKVVLLGFDMKVNERNEHNWHQNHRAHPRPSAYQERFLPPFIKIKEDADKLGLDIVNATVDSELKVFPMVKLKEIING